MIRHGFRLRIARKPDQLSRRPTVVKPTPELSSSKPIARRCAATTPRDSGSLPAWPPQSGFGHDCKAAVILIVCVSRPAASIRSGAASARQFGATIFLYVWRWYRPCTRGTTGFTSRRTSSRVRSTSSDQSSPRVDAPSIGRTDMPGRSALASAAAAFRGNKAPSISAGIEALPSSTRSAYSPATARDSSTRHTFTCRYRRLVTPPSTNCTIGWRSDQKETACVRLAGRPMGRGSIFLWNFCVGNRTAVGRISWLNSKGRFLPVLPFIARDGVCIAARRSVRDADARQSIAKPARQPGHSGGAAQFKSRATIAGGPSPRKAGNASDATAAASSTGGFAWQHGWKHGLRNKRGFFRR